MNIIEFLKICGLNEAYLKKYEDKVWNVNDECVIGFVEDGWHREDKLYVRVELFVTYLPEEALRFKLFKHKSDTFWHENMIRELNVHMVGVKLFQLVDDESAGNNKRKQIEEFIKEFSIE